MGSKLKYSLVFTAMDPNQIDSKDPIRSNVAKKEVRDYHGRFTSKADPSSIPPISVTTNQTGNINTTNPPDLLNFKITNPLIYIKYWWKRIMANEGMELKFKVKPITAISMAVVAFSLAFGLGGVVFPFAFPWLKINGTNITQSPTPSPNEWRETALKGILKKTIIPPIRFFLLTSSDEAITLQPPNNIDLSSLVGKRILATGNYNQKQKLLIITDVQDLEVLSTTPIPIPTSTPTPIPQPTSTPTPEPTLAPTETPTPLTISQ
ncbi:MAG: hypothetical protein AAB656_04730 [Patescibacteria group bacterium]